MKMKKVFFLIFFVTLSSSKTFSQQRVQWHTDLNLALNEASKENKKILSLIKEHEISSNDKIKVGIIGYGSIGG